MLHVRWYFVALLWLQMLCLERASEQFQDALHRFLELRFAVLEDPQAAMAAHCAAAATNAEPPAGAAWCRLGLHWWRGRNHEYDICSDRAAGAVGLDLAAPRRYRVVLTCQVTLRGLGGFGGFNDVGLRLPLLSATLFR